MLGQMMTNAADFMLSQFSQIHKSGFRVGAQKCRELPLLLVASPFALIVAITGPWVLFRRILYKSSGDDGYLNEPAHHMPLAHLHKL